MSNSIVRCFFNINIISMIYISNMCAYSGGKARLGRQIYESICKHELEHFGDDMSSYFEPFVGMGGVLQHFAKNNKQNRNLFACDKEKSIISFWRGIQNGWKPKEITREVYFEIKKNKKEDADYAFAAFGCSFMGLKWCQFYKDQMIRSINRITKQKYSTVMKNVVFIDDSSYINHEPHGMVIYCDPPYDKSWFETKRDNLMGFNIEQFWSTMRIWSENNMVFISEIRAPSDFVSICSMTRHNTFNNSSITEHVFVKKYGAE